MDGQHKRGIRTGVLKVVVVVACLFIFPQRHKGANWYYGNMDLNAVVGTGAKSQTGPKVTIASKSPVG